MSENLLNDIFGGEDSDIGELSEKELKVEFDSEDEPGNLLLTLNHSQHLKRKQRHLKKNQNCTR
jgi:hypothetical protein